MTSGTKVSKLNFELNPRGNLWFNDDSTFGHKLLSRMGWHKGKGLGKNENGIIENIKISKKESNTGVGWKKADIPVAVGCIEYENILQKLQQHFKSKNGTTPVDQKDNLESLEKRSRSARNHLHYQKFVRGKDIFRYSEKDMKCIFLEKPQEAVEDTSQSENTSTPTFNSQLSVNDYFAMKMQQKLKGNPKKDDKPSEVPDRKRKCDSEEREVKRIKFEPQTPIGESPSEQLVLEESASPIDILKSKRKKKHKKSKNERHLLKSCLKNRTNYDLEEARNVSFNEQVSFKLLDTSLEMCEDLNDVTSHVTNEVNDIEDAVVTNVVCNNEQDTATEEKEVEGDVEEEADERPQCFDLPKCSGSNFNFWLESQRQATKMQLYKDMVKKLKKHKILGTSNLLDIKGYGNWGI